MSFTTDGRSTYYIMYLVTHTALLSKLDIKVELDPNLRSCGVPVDIELARLKKYAWPQFSSLM